MKLEVGKKYRIEGSDKPWEVVAIDGGGVAWGLVDGMMRYLFVNVISEWHDKPDPGEGWRLLEPHEDVEEGDEWFFVSCKLWTTVINNTGKQTKDVTYRRRIAPKFVPYTWDDREELRGRWFRRKAKGPSQYERLACFFCLIDGHFYVNSIRNDELLNECEWLDGTPCGKVVV
jgi:hypothetical protein